MIAAVEFNDQMRCSVVEVGPTDEAICIVVQVNLYLGCVQSRGDEKPAKTRFHGRFCGCRKIGERFESRHARMAPARVSVAAQTRLVCERSEESHVYGDERLHRRHQVAQVEERVVQRRGLSSLDPHDLINVHVMDLKPSARFQPSYGDLNRIDRIYVESMEPRGGPPDEHSRRRERSAYSINQSEGAIGSRVISVQSRADSLPRLAA